MAIFSYLYRRRPEPPTDLLSFINPLKHKTMKANLFKALLLAGIALTCGATSTLAKQLFVPFWQTPTPSTVLPTKAAKGDFQVYVTLQWNGCGGRNYTQPPTYDTLVSISQKFFGPVFSKVEITDLSQIVHDQNFDWIKGYYPFISLWDYSDQNEGAHDYTVSECYWNANATTMRCGSYIAGAIPQEIPTNATVEVGASDPLYVFGIWIEEKWIAPDGNPYQFAEREHRLVCQPISLAGLPNNSIEITFPLPLTPKNCEQDYEE